MNAWISTDDRMPEDGVDVVVIDVTAKVPQARVAWLCRHGETVWWRSELGDMLDGEVTHWLPLPTTPKPDTMQEGPR